MVLGVLMSCGLPSFGDSLRGLGVGRGRGGRGKRMRAEKEGSGGLVDGCWSIVQELSCTWNSNFDEDWDLFILQLLINPLWFISCWSRPQGRCEVKVTRENCCRDWHSALLKIKLIAAEDGKNSNFKIVVCCWLDNWCNRITTYCWVD